MAFIAGGVGIFGFIRIRIWNLTVRLHAHVSQTVVLVVRVDGHVCAGSENPLLLVARQEVPQSLDRLGEVLCVGESDHTEVVGVRPVEAGALNKQDLFLEEQVEHHLGVVVDVVDLGVEARERVERAHRFDAADAGDGRELFPDRVALLQEASALAGESVDGLSPAERHLDGGLPGHVGAQARAGQKVESLNKPCLLYTSPSPRDS